MSVPADTPVPPRPRPVRRGARGRALVITVVVLALLVALFFAFAGIYTTYLWFASVGYTRVFSTTLLTRASLFVVFGAVMAAVVATNIWLAYRFRPVFRGNSPEQQSLDRYRLALDPFRRLITVAVSVVFGLIAGQAAASSWQRWMEFRNSVPFGSKDAQFNLDLSFFMFRLPFWQFLVGFGFALVLVSLLVTAVTGYLYGGIRLQTPGDKTSTAVRNHISVLLAAFMLMKAAGYWFDRYALVNAGSPGSRFSGATYTAVNAILPAKSILFVIALICALLFLASVFTRSWLAPGVALGLLVFSAVVIGGIYPAVVQQFTVSPSQPVKEGPYIERGIQATRSAFQLNKVAVQPYSATIANKPGQLAQDEATIANVRLLDPSVVSPTFQALQQIRGYYSFADPLAVDRYSEIGSALPGTSTPRDAVVAVRELNLNQLGSAQQNWANEHIVYTHGFGFVGAYGNTYLPDGSPEFFAYNVPNQGVPPVSQPRIYFGQQSPSYSIVGAPAGSTPRELDYPDDSSPTGQQNYTYTGSGGVSVGSLARRVLFAAKFSDGNILLSSLINKDSRILWLRDPAQRVAQVAPWLTLDSQVYPAVVGGRVVWIVDGYTTSDDFPYSRRTNLANATTNSLSGQTNTTPQGASEVNYMRNSVKAVVDAYDGTVSLYAWDSSDPVLQVWEKAYPGTVKPYSAIPADLLAHLRYPEDLFQVQRSLFATYHVTDPQAFYGGQDFWKIPDDPTIVPASGPAATPPYYLTLQMPGTTAPAFSVTSTFAPQNKQTLAAFMAVDSDPGSSDYGQIRVLQLPRNTTIAGPEQVQNNFESNPNVSAELSLLRRGGSDVQLGNLLTLPVGGGLLYVEPVYVKATGQTSYPLLQKVLVSFGNQIGFANTFQAALDSVFQGNSGGVTLEPQKPGGVTPTKPGTTSPGVTSPSSDLTRALADAQAALVASQNALKAGNFADYGKAQAQLAAAIAAALAAEKAHPASSPAASPSARPSASASAGPTGAGGGSVS